MRPRAALVLGLATALLAGCVNHYLVHPHEPAPALVTWANDFGRDQLWIHVEGARPPGAGPFPTVIVHPEEDQTATDMHGVIWDLAARGYVAIAADYKRLIDERYQRNYFAWRSSKDVTLSIDVARGYPEVDPERVGALGYSEGATVSLLMAAHEPDRIRAVVAYSPITDFPRWYAGKRSGIAPRVLFGLARWQLHVDSGAKNDEDFQRMLRLASPLPMADLIRAPVLLIHGADDTLAYPEESERMAERLKAAGVTTRLIVVPDAGRLFNFREKPQATMAWQATVDWLDRWLRPTRRAADQPPPNPGG